MPILRFDSLFLLHTILTLVDAAALISKSAFKLFLTDTFLDFLPDLKKKWKSSLV